MTRRRRFLAPRLARPMGALAALALALTGGAASAQLATGAPADNLTMNRYPAFSVGTTPTDIAVLPDGRAVVALKGGGISVIPADGSSVVMKTGNRLTVDSSSEKGLLGVVADPNFATNKTLYFYASDGPGNADKHRIRKATLSDANDVTFDPKAVVEGGLEGPANHDGGGLVIFNNQLYISVGDTGANASPPTNKYSSCLNKPNGKILRVNLDGTIPTDNPLSNVAMATACTSTGSAFMQAAPDKRIFAWGFRNPYRFWIDPKTGLMWIGDVGEVTREEISVGPGGRHYGYPFREGTTRWMQTFGAQDCDMDFMPSTACVPPAYDYQNQRDAGNNCVTGGVILEGCGWSGAFGGKTVYVFGDHGTGNLWTLEVAADRKGVVANSRADFGKVAGVAAFRMGGDGALYIVSESQNTVFKVVPKNLTGADCQATGAAGTGGGAGTAGGTAGTSGTAGTGTGAGTAGTSATGAAGTSGSPAATDGGGCGCALTGSSTAGVSLGLLAVAAMLAGLRRRRDG